MTDNIKLLDEQVRASRMFDNWITSNSITGAWVRFWFSPKRVIFLNTPILKVPSRLSLKSTDRILDVGCGYGGVLIYLYKKIKPRQIMEGIDASHLMAKLAAKEIKKRGLAGRINVIQAIATKLPYSDESFDVVLSTHMIKHLSGTNLLLMMNEVRRVLKKGGRFCLWDGGKCGFNGLNEFNIRRLTGGFSSNRHSSDNIILRSSDEIRSFLIQTGFSNINKFNHRYCFYYPVLPRLGFICSK